MKRTLLILFFLGAIGSQAQLVKPAPRYPSLLWEITGNGLSRPSYLFGTMHVSSKMAFHLADSFYLGIRNADVVALETNPESWQEDMVNYKLDNNGDDDSYSFGSNALPNEFLHQSTLKYYKYDQRIETALYSNPSAINNLLYRTYGNDASDFEEDTYLDMYIYQCGKKWGKRVTGVERYAESMKLMKEAYADAAGDKNRKSRSYDVDEDYSQDKLQEAYRKGNLDRLDSINRLNSFSELFDEKFLYRRNEIQASSIDSILKSNSSLFVGVGAAHLPGKRGVIELLRAKGYKLRPVMMGERDSKHKDEVEKIRVPVTFNTNSADDQFFTVEMPGKLYKLEDDNYSYDQRQYADMANGSYYMVTRILTNAWMWGNSSKDVVRQIDSVLYENIPGKMISKKTITRNGYPGFDITSRTRRGDVQRYNIFVTPFEILVFKMSGNGEYVGEGDEANRFFSSIQLHEYNSGTQWQSFTPAFGGFTVQLPHTPYIGNDGSWIFDAQDSAGKTEYRVVRSDIHNYGFAGEDTFDLGLMDESFAASDFIDRRISRKLLTVQGYPALDCRYRDKKGQTFFTRFIIQGPHYYTLVAKGRQETPQVKAFFNSFQFSPLVYGPATLRTDTTRRFTVTSPVFFPAAKEDLPASLLRYAGKDDDDRDFVNELRDMTKSVTVANDSTGEKIYVLYYKTPRYFFDKDSALLGKKASIGADTNWIVKQNIVENTPNGFVSTSLAVTDTNSSRLILARRYYKNGQLWALLTLTDTLTPRSAFIRDFFDTFQPRDTTGTNPFVRKSDLFFDDLASTDSAVHKRALRSIMMVEMADQDADRLRIAIDGLSWKEKNYLAVKKSLIGKMGDMHSQAASDYLKAVYYAAGDTIEFQYAALETLLAQKTAYSYGVFRDIVTAEPPVLTTDDNDYKNYPSLSMLSSSLRKGHYASGDGSFMYDLSDSLALTKTILADILPLINIDDYKQPVMNLLANMIDSSMIRPSDYESYYTKFLLEAKQQLKKQVILEKRMEIQKAELGKKKDNEELYGSKSRESGLGNSDLELYAKLLLPFWDAKPAVRPLLEQLLQSGDKRLKYNIAVLLLKHQLPVADSVLASFAADDAFRYELYADLRDMKELRRFPAASDSPLELGRSKLKNLSSYYNVDTLVFLDKRAAVYKRRNGFIYFFKYKNDKDDGNWKLATVGLVPANGKAFEFTDGGEQDAEKKSYFPGISGERKSDFDFTDLTSTKLENDEPVSDQLDKLLKRTLYAKRKSAAQFYDDRSYDEDSGVEF